MRPLLFIPLLLVLLLPNPASAQNGEEEMVEYARSAGPAEIADEATVLDADGNVLREGTNAWTCVAIPNAPMCVDEQWMSWMDAYSNQMEEVDVTAMGIAYMLQGDDGASNVDPYAEHPTPDNEWVVTGPHIMIIVPDPALLEGLPTDPEAGGPYVMWRGHPLVHVMVPTEGDVVRMHR